VELNGETEQRKGEILAGCRAQARARAGEVARKECEKSGNYRHGELVDYSIDEVTCGPCISSGFSSDPCGKSEFSDLRVCTAAVKTTCEGDIDASEEGPDEPAPQTKDGDEGDNSGPDRPGNTDDATSAIGRIRSGAYSKLPHAVSSPARGPGGAGVTILNKTRYAIVVYLSGPTSRAITIAAGQSREMSLPAGKYEMAAEAPNTGIIPFYGVRVQESDTHYRYQFFVAGR
jgi:hypothetical protein